MRLRSTRVLVVDREHPDPSAIETAAACLRGGGLVVLPTETVYGLGANALDPRAVAGIFDAKGRPATDPLIVHVHGVEELASVARELPPVMRTLAAHFWPGPLTVILPKHGRIPPEVTAGLDTVAVRVPAHPVARRLIAAAAVPVAAPSANLFSRPSPTQVSHVLADLEGRVDVVLDAGPTDVGVESTILDLTVWPPLIRRPGGVSLEALCAVVPDVQLMTGLGDAADAQVSPGQLLRHYAPRARVTVIEGDADAARRHALAEIRRRVAAGVSLAVLAPEEDILHLRGAWDDTAGTRRVVFRAYGSRSDAPRCARELFDALRAVDRPDVDEIVAIAPDAPGIGLAIRDRLMRAAEGRVVRVGAAPAQGAAS